MEQEARLRSKLLTLGSNMIAGMGLLAYLGYLLDDYLNNKVYYCTIIGLLLGFMWSMYETFKLVNWINKDE